MDEPYRIQLSKRVASQLEAIFEYIASDSPQNGSAFIEQILIAIEGLEYFPMRQVEPLQPPNARFPVRTLPIKNYVIFFRVFPDKRLVRIVSVAHGAQRRLKRYKP